MKKCPKCTRIREDSKFYIKTLKDGTKGLRSYCIDCGKTERDVWRKANKEHDDARNNAYNKTNAERIRGEKLRKYWPHLTGSECLIEWNRIFTEQEGRCYFGHLTPRLHVDHNHTTGKPRGLLCYNCNNGLGRFKEDIDLLQKAIVYLSKHKEETTK